MSFSDFDIFLFGIIFGYLLFSLMSVIECSRIMKQKIGVLYVKLFEYHWFKKMTQSTINSWTLFMIGILSIADEYRLRPHIIGIASVQLMYYPYGGYSSKFSQLSTLESSKSRLNLISWLDLEWWWYGDTLTNTFFRVKPRELSAFQRSITRRTVKHIRAFRCFRIKLNDIRDISLFFNVPQLG